MLLLTREKSACQKSLRKMERFVQDKCQNEDTNKFKKAQSLSTFLSAHNNNSNENSSSETLITIDFETVSATKL